MIIGPKKSVFNTSIRKRISTKGRGVDKYKTQEFQGLKFVTRTNFPIYKFI